MAEQNIVMQWKAKFLEWQRVTYNRLRLHLFGESCFYILYNLCFPFSRNFKQVIRFLWKLFDMNNIGCTFNGNHILKNSYYVYSQTCKVQPFQTLHKY